MEAFGKAAFPRRGRKEFRTYMHPREDDVFLLQTTPLGFKSSFKGTLRWFVKLDGGSVSGCAWRQCWKPENPRALEFAMASSALLQFDLLWSQVLPHPSLHHPQSKQPTLAFNPLACSYCQSGHVLLLNQPCLDTCEAREKTDRDGRCSDFSNAWFWFDSISLMFSSKLYKKHLIRISLSPMCLLALPLIFPEIRSFHFSLEVDVLYIVL